MEFSGEPFEWRDALRLEGAWDAGFAKKIFEEYRLFDLEPAQGLLISSIEEIKVAKSKGEERLAIYSPFANRITLRFDLRGYKVVGVDLSERRWLVPEVTIDKDTSTIEMIPRNNDFLFLIWKK